MPRLEFIPNPRRFERVEETIRPQSLKKSNSSIVILPKKPEILNLSASRRNVINFNPILTSSNSMNNSLPIQQIQQIVGKQT